MKRVGSVLLSLLVAMLVQAQELAFKRISKNDGLAENFVADICQDDLGMTWIASWSSISRYDGFRVKSYPIQMYGNGEQRLATDLRGRLWMQNREQVLLYDCAADSLTSAVGEVLGTGDESVKLLFVDCDRNLWYVAGHTLYYDNLAAGRQCRFALPAGEGVAWVACRGTLAYLLLMNGQVTRIDTASGRLIPECKIEGEMSAASRLYIDSRGTLWSYTAHSVQSCLQYKKDDGMQLFRDDRGEALNLITDIDDDEHGTLWIATDNAGIILRDMRSGGLRHLRSVTADAGSLHSNHVSCLFPGRSNTMWVGSSKCGVAYTSLGNAAFGTPQLPMGISDITALAEDRDGNLWLGADGEGLAVKDKATGEWRRFTTADSPLPSDVILCAMKDRGGRLWFGTYGQGIFSIDGGRIQPCQVADEVDYVRCMAEDEEGRLWIGTLRRGLFGWQQETGDTVQFTFYNSALPTSSITAMRYDDGRLYIATPSGLCVMQTADGKIEQIDDNRSSCLCLDRRGLLWVGGEDGSVKIYSTPGMTELKSIILPSRSSRTIVRALATDAKGNIWVTTEEGFTHIVVEYGADGRLVTEQHNYTALDISRDIVFNQNAICLTAGGKVLLGGIGGYAEISPERVAYGNARPKIMFTNLYVQGRLAAVGDKCLPQNLLLSSRLALDYDENTFAIDIATPEIDKAANVRYEYRLGGDREWMALEGSNITFNNLSAGTYTLQVRLQGYDEDCEPAELTIVVRPPLWLSGWAYALYLAVVGLIIWLAIRITRRRNAEKLRMQRIEMDYAKQMEIEEKQLMFFTNISHDLRTPLSLILSPIERLLSAPHIGREESRSMLLLVHRNASLLMEEINQLLDFRKLAKGQQDVKLTNGNLSLFVKELCHTISASGIGKKNVVLDVNLIEANIITAFDRNKMQRIMMNLISNAYKFTEAGGSITVTVDRADGMARISVADTGTGIPDDKKQRIFDRFFQSTNAVDHVGSGIGLHIVKEFTELLGGTVSVEDNYEVVTSHGRERSANKPKGTVFTLLFPLREIETDAEQAPALPETEVQQIDPQDMPLLIVEDNDDFRTFLVDCISPHYPVLAAENGKAALEILRRQQVRLVISDIMMPVMDGLTLCNNIKGDIDLSHIPVILLTAKSADEHIIEGLQEGADDYITKPFNLNILLLRIQKILSWRADVQQKFSTVEIKPSEITVSSLDEQLIERAITEVEKNMADSDYSVEQLGQALGMTRGHLYKKLMAITGKSPVEFIRILRLKRGRQLLEKSGLSVSEVACKVGFSPKVFTKHFKEMYGDTPARIKGNP